MAGMEGIFVGLSSLITGRYNLKALMMSFKVHFKCHLLFKGFLLQLYPLNRMNLLIFLVFYTSILAFNDNLPFKVCICGFPLPLYRESLEGKNRVLFTIVFPIMLSILLMYSRRSVTYSLNCMWFWVFPLKNMLLIYRVGWILGKIFTSQKALELSCSVYSILANREVSVMHFRNNSFIMTRLFKNM